MPRRAASGQSPAMQLRKLAAAARIACRVISGWPDAPSSPLHSPGVSDGAGMVPVDGLGANRERRSGNWAEAPAVEPSRTAIAQINPKRMEPIGMLACLLHLRRDSGQPFVRPLGPDMLSDILTAPVPSSRSAET